jgi:uncharacterized protein (TIGR00369 family)
MTQRDEQATELVHSTMPLCKHLGIDALVATPSEVVLVVDWAPQLCTIGSSLHGGLLMTLADSAGALCAFVNLPAGATGTSTIESKTNFLGAARAGAVRAISRPLHIGSTTIVVETDLRNADDKLVAKTTQTQIVLRPTS